MGNTDSSARKDGLRILCIGDSLTRGFIGPYGLEHHSYADKLSQLISADFPDLKNEVIPKGINGETTMKMLTRLEEELKTDHHYDLLILLGGTNDVGDKKPQVAVDNLKAMQALVQKHKIKNFFIGTMPPSAFDDIQWVSDVKTKINEEIRKLVEESHLIDFANELPMSSLSFEEKKKIWSDNLHLSAAGYDLMAEIIYKKLKLALSAHLEKK